MTREDDRRAALAVLDPDGLFPIRLATERLALVEDLRAIDALGMDAAGEILKQIATRSHRLGGAAGTFGFDAVTDAALALEDRILGIRPPEGRPERQASIRQAMEALLGALGAALSSIEQ